MGTEPITIQPTRRKFTVFFVRCTAAATGRMATAATRSLDIADDGFTLNSRISIGVMSAPPPAPVSPTRNPTTALPRTMYESMCIVPPRSLNQCSARDVIDSLASMQTSGALSPVNRQSARRLAGGGVPNVAAHRRGHPQERDEDCPIRRGAVDPSAGVRVEVSAGAAGGARRRRRCPGRLRAGGWHDRAPPRRLPAAVRRRGRIRLGERVGRSAHGHRSRARGLVGHR